jgi:hypothetical protein
LEPVGYVCQSVFVQVGIGILYTGIYALTTATSNDSDGPATADMADIARLTFEK